MPENKMGRQTNKAGTGRDLLGQTREWKEKASGREVRGKRRRRRKKELEKSIWFSSFPLGGVKEQTAPSGILEASTIFKT